MNAGRSSAGSLLLRVPVLAALAALPARADHPADFRSALDGLRANNMAKVDHEFLKDSSQDGADRLLCLYELGGFYHLQGNFKKSIEFFNTADAVAHDYEGRAVVSAGAAARTAGAVLVNDTLLRFEGFGYDKVMSRTLNALNYVLQGDLEGARVEVRKAEEYQRLEREKHEREMQKAGRPQPGTESASLANPTVQANYHRMFEQVQNVRNSFENAFTYYLSSQIFLAQGEDGLNDAMVEIRRAFQLAPDAPAVRSAYLEIAGAQGGAALDQARSDLRAPALDPPPDPSAASAVVCYEAGLVPELDQVRLALPAMNRLYTLAFPIYRDLGSPQPPVYVIPPAPSRPCATTPVVATRNLAVKSLQERMPGILTRGLAGAVARGGVQQKAEKDYGPLGGFLSKLASAVVTSADRRTWLSLPAEVQVAKCSLPPGTTILAVNGPGWSEPVSVNAVPGSCTFLVVRAFPGFRRIDVRTFVPAAIPAAAPVDQPASPVAQ